MRYLRGPWLRRILAVSLGIGLLGGSALVVVGLASGSGEKPGSGQALGSAQAEASSPRSNSEIELLAVVVEDFAKDGWIVAEVPAERPATITKEQAEAIATEMPGVSAIDSILIHVKDGVHDLDAWVVSLDGSIPTDPLEGIGEVILFMALVDANTGELLYTSLSRKPPPGGFPEDVSPGHQLSQPNSIGSRGLDVD